MHVTAAPQEPNRPSRKAHEPERPTIIRAVALEAVREVAQAAAQAPVQVQALVQALPVLKAVG